MEEEGNRWEENVVILMSTIMIDKDREANVIFTKKNRIAFNGIRSF